MNTFMGLSGYSLIIVGSFLIDTPIITLLATPLFLAGTIILMLFYDKILHKHNRLGMLGVLIICIILGYVCIEFNKFLTQLSNDNFNGISNTAWLKIGIIAVLNLISIFLVYRSFGKENIQNKESSMLGWWLSVTLIIPFMLLIYWIAYKTGNWLGDTGNWLGI